MKKSKLLFWGSIVIAGVFLVWIANSLPQAPKKFAGVKATVYLSPTCGCCKNYVAYLRTEGFDVEDVKISDMNTIKAQYKIPTDLQSCHTTIIGDYIAEGHIPVEGLDKLLTEKPAIRGIALPGMPSSSPGMPGEKFAPFDIYKLLDSGKSNEIFLTI